MFFKKIYTKKIVYDENGKILKVYIVIYPQSLNLEQPPEDKNPNELAISKFDYDNGEEIKEISYLFT